MLVNEFSQVINTTKAHRGYAQHSVVPSLSIEFSGQSIKTNRKRWRTTETSTDVTIRYKVNDFLYTFELNALVPENQINLLDQIVSAVVNNPYKTDSNGEQLELSITPFEFQEETDKQGINKYRAVLTVKGISVLDKNYPKIPVNTEVTFS
ncbi:hypothetical protein SAMN06265182_1262 [Persephonella hydrogeniphila]|uniref:Uncharacterized protein n=2 Tax=Persephonella hydrogeniphila TaxID=198703 RepID=A0A285NKA1_9AQUI|nr:hypothetical protein SAMN06265182_1262 [Persephonella hydrogeniphila]